MKKFLAVLLLASACWACGGGDKKAEEKKPVSNAEPETPAAPAPAPATAAKDGKALIEASDCRTCHKDNEKLIGPAYADVAKKYTDADVDKLADKVIAGGTGNWGQIPMAGHPNVSKEDAQAMVKYILTLKK